MKQVFRKTLSLVLALALTGSLGLTAAASDALGEDLTATDTLLNQETALSTNVFWSSAYSDLRTENLITYSPNEDVTPIVTYGSTLTSRSTVSSMAKTLEAEGYRVVAGMNGDFYNVGTGLPIGLVISDGKLISSDGGYYAIGFRSNGTAVLGKPAVKVSADLGYTLLDNYDVPTAVVRQITGVNKARVSTGGIYLYTYDFNAKHTTGNTEAGVDVLCTIVDGSLSIGGELTLEVEQVLEAASATAIGPDQVVLSANLQSSAFHVDALRNTPVGSVITLTATAASDEWNDVEYGLGALYSLVEYGSVASGLQGGVSPRTAIGQKADGTLVFYTIDGRKSGHSIGASLTQVAQRLIELGCVTALCLDGGGSTTMSVTEPNAYTSKTISTPSEGSERAVSNQVFLVASSEATGKLNHFYVQAENPYVLAGSKVHITASAVDTNFIPMDKDYDLEADGGDMDGSVLTTPSRGGEITVTASSGGKEGSTTVYAITDPDSITVRNSSGAVLTALNVAPGASAVLTPSAVYKRQALKADPEAFTWSVTGDIGTVDQSGLFTASAPGTGAITVSAGGKSVTIPVTVSRLALSTVEDFEGASLSSTFVDFGGGMSMAQATDADHVRLGRGSGKLTYGLQNDGTAALSCYLPLSSLYTQLNLWIYGDGSGSIFSLLTSDGNQETATDAAVLDFTGWKQVTAVLPAGAAYLTGLRVTGVPAYDIDELGEQIVTYPNASGVLYIDQIVGSFGGTVDNEAPTVTLRAEGGVITGAVSDAVDGVLPQASVSVTFDGAEQTFTYNASTGALSVSAVTDGEAHRVTVTARDGSGNIGRASVDLAAADGTAHKFTDINEYWAAIYVDFLYTSGITTGYDDGTFRPNQNITRAQFSVMLYRYLGLDESKYAGVTLPFADNASIPEYAVPAIRALYTEGVINGSTGADGKLYFNPGSSLTRAQAATMIGRTQEKGYATTALTFTDTAAIPAYATYYIQTMAAQGVIGGYTDGSFRPNANITRGQMAKILYTLL